MINFSDPGILFNILINLAEEGSAEEEVRRHVRWPRLGLRFCQVNPKGARMKGARNGLFFDILNDSENERFFMMHTSAMVPPFGPAGTSRAFPQRIAGTLVGQEHAPTETSRPLSTGPHPLWSFAKFRGRSSFATPLIGFGAHGARPHIHPAVTVGGPYWHSVCDGFHVFRVLGQYFRIVVIMRLRILATIAIDLLFEIIQNYGGLQQLHQPAKPHRHKQRPATHHHGRGPCMCIFLLALNRHTHPARGPPFARPPLGSPHQGDCEKFTEGGLKRS